ncbi:MAG: CRISPR-associated protein Cas4 [ANME-2 cluster archaeon]|nr:CRISPR-associated protein Cas4 [ANME-2 cluster archaeon]
MKITGVKINYLHICHTKLWLFSHNIIYQREQLLHHIVSFWCESFLQQFFIF